jgi:hypothetical protein
MLWPAVGWAEDAPAQDGLEHDAHLDLCEGGAEASPDAAAERDPTARSASHVCSCGG